MQVAQGVTAQLLPGTNVHEEYLGDCRRYQFHYSDTVLNDSAASVFSPAANEYPLSLERPRRSYSSDSSPKSRRFSCTWPGRAHGWVQ